MSVWICLTVVLVAVSLSLISSQDAPPPIAFLATVPDTKFSCQDKKYGYYADTEANCQVFHVCLNNYKWSFLCPNQSLFNQHYLVCDQPVNVDCSKSDSFLWVNDNLNTDKKFLEGGPGAAAPGAPAPAPAAK